MGFGGGFYHSNRNKTDTKHHKIGTKYWDHCCVSLTMWISGLCSMEGIWEILELWAKKSHQMLQAEPNGSLEDSDAEKWRVDAVLGGFVCQLDTSQSHQRKKPQIRKCLPKIQM